MIPSPNDARTALVRAGAARQLLASRGRWPIAYLLVYALGSSATIIALGLGGHGGIIVAGFLWPCLIVIMQRIAHLRPVTQRGGRRLVDRAILIWGVVYVAGVTVGEYVFPHNSWYWILFGFSATIPFLISAHRGRTAHT